MKQITIKEDGVSKSESVDFINTQVAGGSADWMPDDDTAEGVITITENGEYHPKDYGLYGFNKVIINVDGGAAAYPSGVKPPVVTGVGASVVGIMRNTNYPYNMGVYRVEIQEVDGTPTLVRTKLAERYYEYNPVTIVLVLKPAKLKYKLGEKIDYAGMVVMLMDETGHTFTDDTFPQGVISWSPRKNSLYPEYDLITPILRAGDEREGRYTDGNGLNVLAVNIAVFRYNTGATVHDTHEAVMTGYGRNVFGTCMSGPNAGKNVTLGLEYYGSGNRDPYYIYATIYEGELYVRALKKERLVLFCIPKTAAYYDTSYKPAVTYVMPVSNEPYRTDRWIKLKNMSDHFSYYTLSPSSDIPESTALDIHQEDVSNLRQYTSIIPVSWYPDKYPYNRVRKEYLYDEFEIEVEDA